MEVSADYVILAQIWLPDDAPGSAEDLSIFISGYHLIARYAEPANHITNGRSSRRKMNRSMIENPMVTIIQAMIRLDMHI
jgi:hypothetical protein